MHEVPKSRRRQSFEVDITVLARDVRLCDGLGAARTGAGAGAENTRGVICDASAHGNINALTRNPARANAVFVRAIPVDTYNPYSLMWWQNEPSDHEDLSLKNKSKSAFS
jgi:hypothetical protein